MDAITQKYQEQDQQMLGADKEFKELLKNSNNPIKNEEYIQAKAVNIPEFLDNGLVSNP